MTTILNQTRTHGTWGPFGSKGDDRYIVATQNEEAFSACLLTIIEQRFNASARISSQPSPGQKGLLEITVHWWHDGGSQISYRVEAFSGQETISVRVPDFLPSMAAFQFTNSLPSRPDLYIGTPFGNIAIGNASNGLCGGMIYAVRDYFEAKQSIPLGDAVPDCGPLFDHLVHRLFDSFDIPLGISKYLELMNPLLPDHETDASKLGAAPHGRSWRMIVEEWPAIRSDLDHGYLCPLGLVHVKSADFMQLGGNHQVMAYGYDLTGKDLQDLTLHIYDPNAPRNNGVTLKINLGSYEHTLQVQWTGKPVHSFFRTRYCFAAPPDYHGVIGYKATLTAVANHKLVCADNSGASNLIANRTLAGTWEKFEVRVMGSNRVALKSLANNKYVCAENAGASPLIANRDQAGIWETFELHYLPDNKVSLKSIANQKYVCAENAGNQALVANRNKVGPWEMFTLSVL